MTDKALIGCAGFGGVEIALRAAGLETVGIELDPAIAEVNRFNGGNVITADLLTINPADYIGWLLYHFSPPCPNFSLANHAGSESEIDIMLARKICEFIRVGRPRYFTLENVWMYRKSLSWLLIWYTLLEEGYGVEAWHLNAADYGVPQSRKRMIVIARRDGLEPIKPWPTHQKEPDMFSERWCGWYEAIKDLIPDLPETQFAPWQEKAMPDEMLSFILDQGARSKPKTAHLPADTITANTNQTGVKAFIMASANTGANNGNGTIRGKDEPMFTVLANSAEKNASPKAFVIGGQRVQIRSGDVPIFTICASNKLDARIFVTGKVVPAKAFIVDCQNNGKIKENGKRGLTIRGQDQPIFTVTASANKRTVRAGLPSGRIVSMTVRCLARFQDFPDWFVLPGEPGLIDNPILLADKRSDRELACRGIGNALPPGMDRAVLRSLGLGIEDWK